MGAPKGNKNAEIWTLEEAKKFFDKAAELALNKEYDFIGEIAVDLGKEKGVYDYLINKFPDEGLDGMKRLIFSRCEANCYWNGKKGNITPSLAIMNLKSNHGWKDRFQHEGSNENPIKHTHDININVLKTRNEIYESEEEIDD